jgi:hypothetical protein
MCAGCLITGLVQQWPHVAVVAPTGRSWRGRTGMIGDRVHRRPYVASHAPSR